MSDTIGPQITDNGTRGVLQFHWLPDDLQNAEDSTQGADFERGADRWRRPFTRPATATDRTLLQHLGYMPPDDLPTRVSFPAGGVRRRRWPQLESDES